MCTVLESSICFAGGMLTGMLSQQLHYVLYLCECSLGHGAKTYGQKLVHQTNLNSIKHYVSRNVSLMKQLLSHRLNHLLSGEKKKSLNLSHIFRNTILLQQNWSAC